MADTNYEVDYNDPRFTNVNNDRKDAIKESDKMYDGMINSSDSFYNDQIKASKNWADKQTEIQNEQTDFAIEKIEQQKDWAKKDYTKEQSGAYADWQKQSNQFGANAEQMAANGMANTGFSESSQVSMYNTYQNRVATARESYVRAVANYDNMINDAKLQNNAALAEIAFTALQDQLELSLAGFQYKNTLITQKAEAKRAINTRFDTLWQNVLDQINKENTLAEEVRQYNTSLAETKRHNAATEKATQDALALDREKFAWQKAQAASSSSGGGGGTTIKKSSSKSSKGGSPKISNKSSGKNVVARVFNNAKKTSNTDKSSSNEPTIDMNSVLALGYGPISAAKLNQLVKEGKAVKYVEGNKIKFRPSVNGR